jgi:hypothetical protein
VETALEALNSVDNVTVTGNAGGPWTVTFGGTQSNTNVSRLDGDVSSATNGTLVRTLSYTFDAAGDLTAASDPDSSLVDVSSSPRNRGVIMPRDGERRHTRTMTGHGGPGVPSLAVIATDTSAINGASSTHLQEETKPAGNLRNGKGIRVIDVLENVCTVSTRCCARCNCRRMPPLRNGLDMAAACASWRAWTRTAARHSAWKRTVSSSAPRNWAASRHIAGATNSHFPSTRRPPKNPAVGERREARRLDFGTTGGQNVGSRSW